MKRLPALFLALVLAAAPLSGCAAKAAVLPAGDAATPGAAAPTEAPVTLTVAGKWEESPALEALAASFTQQNPGCRIEYEYLQDYGDSLPKRLSSADSGVDLFITENIQADSALLPYALELYSRSEALDLSGCFDGLIQNFAFKEDGTADKLYAVPLGAELRGMYVNTTLLSSLGLAVPGNRAEFLAACQTLLDAGYIPMQANPGSAAQHFLYPYVANLVAHAADYDGLCARIESRADGIAGEFREPLQFLYTMVEKGYYNYKYVENTYGAFTDGSGEGAARSFFHITGEAGAYQKADDTGLVAFMPQVMSLGNLMEKTKADYHSGIEYTFILSPVGEDGGYAYMSPSSGIAVNRSSAHLDWALRFMNYLFRPENNKTFASLSGITPNTADAFDEIRARFDVPEDRICQLGSVTFDYNFYKVIADTLQDISKANNPKYMIDNGNGTYSMYPFEHYMELLTERFAGA